MISLRHKTSKINNYSFKQAEIIDLQSQPQFMALSSVIFSMYILMTHINIILNSQQFTHYTTEITDLNSFYLMHHLCVSVGRLFTRALRDWELRGLLLLELY